MPDDNMLDRVYRDLRNRVENLNRNFKTQMARNEVSGVTIAFKPLTKAEAPLAADNADEGDVLMITDGRKAAEGAGLGTGQPCYYDPVTDKWLRFRDDTEVTV